LHGGLGKGESDIPVCGVVVEQPRGGLEEAFVVGGFTQPAGLELAREGIGGGECGRDVALGG
jgi:hypothetical protein